MADAIAELEVVLVHPDGTRKPGSIRIGVPVRVSDSEAHCKVELPGLYEDTRPIIGTDTLQALLLAVRFAAQSLALFIDDGGRVLAPDGSPMPLHAYFGALLPTSRRESGTTSGRMAGRRG
jgi:hypothetical protein